MAHITYYFLGQRRRVPFDGSAEELRQYRRNQRRARDSRRRVRERAFKLVCSADLDSSLAAVADHLSSCDSSNRLPEMLEVLMDAPPRVFWATFHSFWSCCDDTWDWHAWLLCLLPKNKAATGDRRPRLARGTNSLKLDRRR